MQPLKTLGQYASQFVRVSPINNVYGIARTLLAIGTLSTLLANKTYELFPNIVGTQAVPSHEGFGKYSVFCLFNGKDLYVGKLLAICILLLVISGWRPRFTGVLHWWITISFLISVPLIDGGDQISSIITFMLIPLTLADGRKWHWNSQAPLRNTLFEKTINLFVHSFVWIIRLQVAVLYFNAATAKLSVTEWVNGTAIYYWFTHPTFGMPAYLEFIGLPLVTNSISVLLMSWGTILLEITLFGGLFMTERSRRILLPMALFFHFFILLVHGLFSFFFAMAASLILYLHPISVPFNFYWAKAIWRKLVHKPTAITSV